MPDLREQLQQLLQGHVCMMGLGNVFCGDDGFGVRMAEELKSEGRNPRAEVKTRTAVFRASDLELQTSAFGAM